MGGLRLDLAPGLLQRFQLFIDLRFFCMQRCGTQDEPFLAVFYRLAQRLELLFLVGLTAVGDANAFGQRQKDDMGAG